MDERLSMLKEWGCDVDGALARMMGDEGFYFDCLNMVLYDSAFDDLSRYLDEDNIKGAFSCAHTLKGVLGNVGVTPMYKKATEIVEPLRHGRSDGAREGLAELYKMKQKLNDIIKN